MSWTCQTCGTSSNATTPALVAITGQCAGCRGKAGWTTDNNPNCNHSCSVPPGATVCVICPQTPAQANVPAQPTQKSHTQGQNGWKFKAGDKVVLSKWSAFPGSGVEWIDDLESEVGKVVELTKQYRESIHAWEFPPRPGRQENGFIWLESGMTLYTEVPATIRSGANSEAPEWKVSRACVNDNECPKCGAPLPVKGAKDCGWHS